MSNIFIKLRRKGFNYYTDYTQRYLETVFNQSSYYQTLRHERAELSCEICFDSSPWLTFSANWLCNYSSEQTVRFAEALAEAFKTKYEIAHDFEKDKSACCMTYYFTKNKAYAAVNEDPFIRDGPPKLGIYCYSRCLRDQQPAVISVQNFGGVSTGITVETTCAAGVIELTDFHILYQDTHGIEPYVSKMPTSIKADYARPQTTIYKFGDFSIPEGVNLYSTKLMGRAKQEQCNKRSFSVKFIPLLSGEDPAELEISLTADSAPYSEARLLLNNNTAARPQFTPL